MPPARADDAPPLAPWQPRSTKARTPLSLSRFDPAAKPFSTGSKTQDMAAVETLAIELDRLQERVDDPTKHWKFSMGDVDVRKQWPQYQQAYEALLGATSTPWAPWTIVPADSKTHRNLMIATVVRNTLQQLKLRYPPSDPAFIKGLEIK